MHTVPTLDLYRELEVDRSATPETIEAAWRSLVKRHHPDVASDRVAAVERIKRLNLAHEWLADRRLREMYDLTQLRRRHSAVTLDDGPVRGADGSVPRPAAMATMPWRIGGFTLPSTALLSTVVVALLVAAALGSVALYQPPPPTGAMAAGPNDGSPSPRATGSVAQSTSAPSTAVPLPGPAFEADMPDDCTGLDRVVEGTSDGREARLLFLQCTDDRTFGPLVYVRAGRSWTLVGSGRMEGAIPLAAGFGSLTGAPDEYWVAWTRGDTESWLVVYEIIDTGSRAIWHSLQADLPRWRQAQYAYYANAGPRGRLEIRSTDSDTGRCETCPGQRYLEVYEWDGTAMAQTYRNPE